MSEDGRPLEPPVIRRVNHGRGHSYYIDEAKQTGSTSALSKGYPKHLEKWAAESTAWYAIDHWDELSEESTKTRLDRMLAARFEDRDTAARRGVEVHRLAQRYLAGEDIADLVPDELEGHVAAYERFVVDWQPRELLVEATVANPTRGYCGTLDVVADLADGFRWLYDIKTSRSGVFQEAALQVASYRYAEWVDTADGVVPMLPVDACAVLWLKADRTYEFVPVDAGLQTFRVFLQVLEIARFTERDDVLLASHDGPPVREVRP